jgi:hypothetical protein
MIYRDVKAVTLTGNTSTSITDVDQNADAIMVLGTRRFKFYPDGDDTSVNYIVRAGTVATAAKIVTEIPAKFGNNATLSQTNTVYLLYGDGDGD